MEKTKPLKIAYLTPSLHIAGGIERVLTMKASYLAEQFGYDVTIILTDGKDKPMAYPLSSEVKVVNLDIGFEELWSCGFAKKTLLYLKKQRLELPGDKGDPIFLFQHLASRKSAFR